MEIYQEISNIKQQGKSCVLVTVVDKEGDGPALVGIKMLVMPDGKTIGTVGGGALELFAIKEAQDVLEKRASCMKKFNLSPDTEVKADVHTGMICGGAVSVFFEYITGGNPVYIFGAGHCGKSLAQHLAKMDYFVTCLDHRNEWLSEIEGADKLTLLNMDKMAEEVEFEPNCYIVIATPSHVYDFAVLKEILKRPVNAKYIGMLGSKKKVAIFFDRIKNEIGESVDVSNLYTPAGLDIGGGTPEEIATSIIAEMQAVRYGKAGNMNMRVKK